MQKSLPPHVEEFDDDVESIYPGCIHGNNFPQPFDKGALNAVSCSACCTLYINRPHHRLLRPLFLHLHTLPPPAGFEN